MQTDLTSGAHHEKTRPLYVWGRPRGKRKRRNRLDLCGSQPPVTPAQARLAVGRPLRGHGTPLAAGGQKHRGPAWLALGYGVVCALGGVDAGEAAQLTRAGSVSGRACCGAGVHRATGRSLAADAGPCQDCASVCRAGQGGGGRDQDVDPACGHRLWLCRSEPALVRYHSAGVTHWVSQRTGDCARLGTALWPRPAEAQNPCGAGGRHGTGSGRDDPQSGQRTPPLCQGQARAPLGAMHAVAKRLIPQIVPWITTGVVAKGKIVHAGVLQARAIVRNKVGKKVEFGLPYLLSRLGGGYVFGTLIRGVVDESKMPLQALAGYRAIFGAQATPALVVYDRGGYATATIRALDNEGVKEIGIQPKGQGAWHVAEAVRETVRSERGKTEGIIGTLKTDKYGFNRPTERLWHTLEMAGPRSILSFNLNKLMRDLVQAGR